MAWLGKISTNLGNLGDFAGAVNKLSESVKNIERNFDSALGFEAKSSSESSEGTFPSAGAVQLSPRDDDDDDARGVCTNFGVLSFGCFGTRAE